MDQRRGLIAALDHACRRKAVLVVFSLSQLARSTRDRLAIADRLELAGADLVSLPFIGSHHELGLWTGQLPGTLLVRSEQEGIL